MFKFLRNFFKNFKDIGSIAPSSRFLARIISTFTELHTPAKGKFLEIGAGTGNITKYLLEIQDQRTFKSYEINEEFLPILNKKFESEKVTIESKNFLTDNIREKFDTIICCLPLANFSQKENDKISEKMSSLLKENGTLIYFEYLLFSDMKNIDKFKVDNLEEIHRESMFLNIPPARVIVLKKKTIYSLD